MPSRTEQRRIPLLAAVLRAVSNDTTLPPGTVLNPEQLDWLLESGLGPLLWRLAPPSGYAGSPDCAQKLQAADLTSRVLTADLLAVVERTLGLLNGAEVEPTLLKGIAYATTYYPAPHLRLMRDVDLLVPSSRLAKAESVLIEAGFHLPSYAPPSRWQHHHHAPPLYHPGMDLWIELHTALLPPGAEASGEAPLDLSAIDQNRRPASFGCRQVSRLSPEFEMAYLAVGWCGNLTTEFGRFGQQTALIDAAYLLKSVDDRFDWDRVLGWSRGTLTGASTYILLSYLHRHGAFTDPQRVLPALSKAQDYVGAATATFIHRLLDKHLLGDHLPERTISIHVIGNIFDALIARRPFWFNWLAIPASVLLPRREERRFQARYHWDRLVSLIGR